MKLYRTVTYTSLTIVLLACILIASLPLRFPGAIIFWKPVVTFTIPAVVLVALLFIQPLVARRNFRILLISVTVLALIATAAGQMHLITLPLFLLAVDAMYLTLRKAPDSPSLNGSK